MEPIEKKHEAQSVKSTVDQMRAFNAVRTSTKNTQGKWIARRKLGDLGDIRLYTGSNFFSATKEISQDQIIMTIGTVAFVRVDRPHPQIESRKQHHRDKDYCPLY